MAVLSCEGGDGEEEGGEDEGTTEEEEEEEGYSKLTSRSLPFILCVLGQRQQTSAATAHVARFRPWRGGVRADREDTGSNKKLV